MPKTKQQKEEIVKTLVDKIASAKSLIIACQDGLTVEAAQELREKCRQERVDFISVKKTLLRRALASRGFEEANIKAMSGSLALALSADDEVAPAKILKTFAKTHEQVAFRGGLLEGRLIGVEEVNFLASLPGKIELIAKVVGSIKAPVSGFVNVLAGNLRGLINVLNAIKNK
ncbi:50S ribosomal protein L10 [Candidatus Falkowbacteria bacterium]|nr:50S ribosomal protein L10 [Candidatus Falkowbacteria bacterium]